MWAAWPASASTDASKGLSTILGAQLLPGARGERPSPVRSVFSAQARSISINGIDGVAGSKWVDFGLMAFGLSVRSPEDEEGEAPELVPFPYGGPRQAGCWLWAGRARHSGAKLQIAAPASGQREYTSCRQHVPARPYVPAAKASPAQQVGLQSAYLPAILLTARGSLTAVPLTLQGE